MCDIFKSKIPEDYIEKSYAKLMDELLSMAKDAESLEDIDTRINKFKTILETGMNGIEEMRIEMLLLTRKPWYDPKEAVRLLSEAAENGNVQAQFKLGCILFNGIDDIPADKIMSQYWIDKAEEGGYTI